MRCSTGVTSLMDTRARPATLQTVVASTGRAALTSASPSRTSRARSSRRWPKQRPRLQPSAITNTHYGPMKGRLTAPLGAFDHSIQAVTPRRSPRSSRTRSTDNRATRLGSVAENDAPRAQPGHPAGHQPPPRHPPQRLQRRLSCRPRSSPSSACSSRSTCSPGFYLSVRRSHADVVRRPRPGCKANCTDPLSGGLDALATGDLTRHIDAQAPGGDRRHHPRRARLTSLTPSTTIGEKVAGSIRRRSNAMTAELRTMIGDGPRRPARVSAASQQMSQTSQEAGRANRRDRPGQSSDVAQGRRAPGHDDRRSPARPPDGGDRRGQRSRPGNALATAEVGQDARRAAGEGVAAAEQADGGHCAQVRDSSAAVTAAIVGAGR